MDRKYINRPWNYLYDIHTRASNKKNTKSILSSNIAEKIKFTIGNYYLIINSYNLRDVLVLPEINYIPKQHKSIKGISTIAESMTAIIDLHYMLFHTASKLSDSSRLLVLQNQEFMPIALIVDQVHEKINLENKDYTKLTDLEQKSPQVISSISNRAYVQQEVWYDFDIQKFLISDLLLSIGLLQQ